MLRQSLATATCRGPKACRILRVTATSNLSWLAMPLLLTTIRGTVAVQALMKSLNSAFIRHPRKKMCCLHCLKVSIPTTTNPRKAGKEDLGRLAGRIAAVPFVATTVAVVLRDAIIAAVPLQWMRSHAATGHVGMLRIANVRNNLSGPSHHRLTGHPLRSPTSATPTSSPLRCRTLFAHLPLRPGPPT